MSHRQPPLSPESGGPDFDRLSLTNLVTYYLGKIKIDIAQNIAYRGAVAIWVLGNVMQPLVSLIIWRTVADSNEGNVGGFSANEYTAYFVVVMFVSHMTFIWHMWEFEWRIRTGYFSPILLRPIHPIHNDISENLGYKVVGLVGVVPAMILLSIIFNADFGTASWRSVAAFIPALILAMALRFVIEWTLALAAFWMTKTTALNGLFQTFYLFLGGSFAPLDVMPGWVQTVASYSPFQWSLAFPVETALGRRSAEVTLRGYGLQAVWIGLALAVLRILWRRAASKYSAVGA